MDLLISKECGNHAFRMVLPWPYVAFLSLLPLHCYQSHTLLPLILLPPVSWEHTFLRLLLLLLLFMSIAVKVRLLAMNSGTFKIGTECLLESNHKVLSTTALIIEWFFVNITCHSSYPASAGPSYTCWPAFDCKYTSWPDMIAVITEAGQSHAAWPVSCCCATITLYWQHGLSDFPSKVVPQTIAVGSWSSMTGRLCVQ